MVTEKELDETLDEFLSKFAGERYVLVQITNADSQHKLPMQVTKTIITNTDNQPK